MPHDKGDFISLARISGFMLSYGRREGKERRVEFINQTHTHTHPLTHTHARAHLNIYIHV